MSDIVVRQPGRNDIPSVQSSTFTNNCDTSEQQADNTSTDAASAASDSPTMIGVGPLKNASTLTIQRRFRAFDVLSLCTGCEVEKKYNVYGKDGERIYSAKESSQCICRFCCGPARELQFQICDTTGKSIIQVSRPFKCSGICCGICYPYCTQELTVSINNETAGTIRERATWCYPVYHIFDSLGAPLLKIRGPFCHFGCCLEDVAFVVTTAKESENPNRCVATITKKWNGWVNSGVLDVAAFIIDFEPSISISVEERALIFSAAFLIDLMYYENGGSV